MPFPPPGTGMDPQAADLFYELADLTGEERARYFDEHTVKLEVRREVEGLLSFDTAEDSRLDEIVQQAMDTTFGVTDRSAAGATLGPYRLVRMIGRGGMGTVYLAERSDGEVEQRVAVKFLRWSRYDPVIRDRFLQERQILATLGHPGIARLLDAGHTADGQPYLVMEHIDGVPIDVYGEKLDLAAKLRLFGQVCEAVSCAHQNLIVHRDLKPSNILVDGAGRPKLLDFGIAKILDTDEDQTHTAERMLTPEYASPEQVRGAAQSTATDVYSLGAILYKLLTGRSPHAAGGSPTREEMMAAIGSREPPRVSSTNRELPRDLDFIVAKALRKEPSERYASVEALADDVRAFLEWRPVRARSGSAWYRTRKFARRYRLMVAMVMLTIVGLSLGVYFANRERAIAERRFRQVRLLADQFIALDSDISALPGSTKVRNRIVSESLEYLTALGAEARRDRDLALDIGRAYLRIARVQGVPIGANLGQFVQAEESLRKADGFVDRVLAADAGNRQALLLSAEIAHDRMAVVDVEDRRDEALAQAKKAALRLDQLIERGARSPDELTTATRLFGNIAVAYENSGRFDEAVRYCRRAIETSQSIESGTGRRGVIYGVLSIALRRMGDLEGALEAIRESRRLLEGGAATGEMTQRLNLINALVREGLVLGSDSDVSLGRPEEALVSFGKALEIAEDLARKDLQDNRSRGLIAVISREIGDIVSHGDPRKALAVYDHALARIRETKANARAQRQEADLLASSSYPARRIHGKADARERIDAAFRLLHSTGQLPAEKIEPLSEPDHVLHALADHYAETGEPGEAIEIYQEMVAKYSAWNAAPKTDIRDANSFSLAWAALSRLLRRAGRLEEAAGMDARRRELWDYWEQKLPNNPFVHRQVAAVR